MAVIKKIRTASLLHLKKSKERFAVMTAYDYPGARALDEAGIEVHEFWRSLSYFDTERIEYPRIPMHAIFDEETRRKSCYSASFGYKNSRRAISRYSNRHYKRS